MLPKVRQVTADDEKTDEPSGPMRIMQLQGAYRLAVAAAIVLAAAIGIPDRSAAQSPEVLSVEIGKSRILRLDAEPSVISIGDPDIADIIVEEDRIIFLVGQMQGETNVYILGDNGKPLLSADVVVTPHADRHVTLNRGVDEYVLSCNPRCAVVAAPVVQGPEAMAGDTTLPSALPIPGQQGAASRPAGAGTGPMPNPLQGSLGNMMQQMMGGALNSAQPGLQ